MSNPFQAALDSLHLSEQPIGVMRQVRDYLQTLAAEYAKAPYDLDGASPFAVAAQSCPANLAHHRRLRAQLIALAN
jgi:hypothetical protein